MKALLTNKTKAPWHTPFLRSIGDVFKILTLWIAFTALTAPNMAKAQPDFASPSTNPFGLTSISDSSSNYPDFVDIDNDGDMDIITGVNKYDTIPFYENTGTQDNPSFVRQDTFYIGNDTYSSNAPEFADIDDDDDMDAFFSSGLFSGDFSFNENTGTPESPSFDTTQINPYNLNSLGIGKEASPTFVDLDNDGDQDMIAAMFNYLNADSLVYSENTGSAASPAFGPTQRNPFGITTDAITADTSIITDIVTADFDEDNDYDLLVSALDTSETSPGSNFYYYENTGDASSPSFGAPDKNPFGLATLNEEVLQAISLADLDNDTDLDMIAGDGSGNFRYFENTNNVTSTPQKISPEKLRVYPNPVHNQFRIKAPYTIEHGILTNNQGVVVHKFNKREMKHGMVDIASLPAGHYFLQLHIKNLKAPITRKLIKY